MGLTPAEPISIFSNQQGAVQSDVNPATIARCSPKPPIASPNLAGNPSRAAPKYSYGIWRMVTGSATSTRPGQRPSPRIRRTHHRYHPNPATMSPRNLIAMVIRTISSIFFPWPNQRQDQRPFDHNDGQPISSIAVNPFRPTNINK
ncbi:hypothetical protein ACLOJK_038772 [Asimina triloba]